MTKQNTYQKFLAQVYIYRQKQKESIHQRVNYIYYIYMWIRHTAGSFIEDAQAKKESGYTSHIALRYYILVWGFIRRLKFYSL